MTPNRSRVMMHGRAAHRPDIQTGTLRHHGLGQAADLSCGGRSGKLHACGRRAAHEPVGGQPAGVGARARAERAAVSPACARPRADRAGRVAVPHRARRFCEAPEGRDDACRHAREADRRPAGHGDHGPRRDLADAAHPRVHRPLSGNPHRAEADRRGAGPVHARGRRRRAALGADAERPDPPAAVHRAFSRLCVEPVHPQVRHAAGHRANSTSTASSPTAAPSRCI